MVLAEALEGGSQVVVREEVGWIFFHSAAHDRPVQREAVVLRRQHHQPRGVRQLQAAIS